MIMAFSLSVDWYKGINVSWKPAVSILMVEDHEVGGIRVPETLLQSFQLTRRNITENRNLHISHCEAFKSDVFPSLSL